MEAQQKWTLTMDHEPLLRQQISDLINEIGCTQKNLPVNPKINLLFEKLINLLKILRKDAFSKDAASLSYSLQFGVNRTQTKQFRSTTKDLFITSLSDDVPTSIPDNVDLHRYNFIPEMKYMIDNFMTQKQVSQLELVRQQILSHNYFITTFNLFKNFQILAAQSKGKTYKQTLRANIYGLLSIIRPTSEYMQKLDETKCLLQRIIDSSEQLRDQYGEILVAMYGSSVNGLALMNSSDLDLTLIVTSGEKVDHMELLEQVYLLLGTNKRCSHSQLLPIKRLQLLKFRDKQTSLSVDVTVNAICQIYNSQMVATYAQIDSRFLNLALVLKHWNSTLFKEANLKLNSYSLVLMLIAFLQEKGILPNIHILGSGQKKLARYELQYYANIYAKNLRLVVQPNEANVAFETDIQNIEDSFIPACQSLETEDLLLEFFNFYLYNFKLGEQVIQVDGLTPFAPYNFNAHTQFQIDDSFKIADPFQPYYNPAKVIRMGSDLERQYQKAMVLTLFNLLRHGQMFNKSESK